MKYSAIFLASILFAASAWAESEDPSYEPNRNSKPKPSDKTAKPKSSEKVTKVQPLPTEPAPRVEVQAPPTRRVLLILNGRPVYEDDADAPKILAEIEADKKKGGKTENYREERYAPRDNIDGAPAPAANPPRAEKGYFSQPGDDLTADKPGAPPAVQNPALFEEFPMPGGVLSSRAFDCYEEIAKLKANVETVSRCLDNRGKENARLIHTSDEVVKNISALAAIYPKRQTFVDHCAVVKRAALVLNNELNQVPWKWAQVRWSFNALVKDVEPLRRYAKALADAEPPPVPVLNKKGQVELDKDGKPRYQDVPDMATDPEAERREARIRATQDETERARRFYEARQAQKNKPDFDLDGKKIGE